MRRRFRSWSSGFPISVGSRSESRSAVMKPGRRSGGRSAQLKLIPSLRARGYLPNSWRNFPGDDYRWARCCCAILPQATVRQGGRMLARLARLPLVSVAGSHANSGPVGDVAHQNVLPDVGWGMLSDVRVGHRWSSVSWFRLRRAWGWLVAALSTMTLVVGGARERDGAHTFGLDVRPIGSHQCPSGQ